MPTLTNAHLISKNNTTEQKVLHTFYSLHLTFSFAKRAGKHLKGQRTGFLCESKYEWLLHYRCATMCFYWLLSG